MTRRTEPAPAGPRSRQDPAWAVATTHQHCSLISGGARAAGGPVEGVYHRGHASQSLRQAAEPYWSGEPVSELVEFSDQKSAVAGDLKERPPWVARLEGRQLHGGVVDDSSGEAGTLACRCLAVVAPETGGAATCFRLQLLGHDEIDRTTISSSKPGRFNRASQTRCQARW